MRATSPCTTKVNASSTSHHSKNRVGYGRPSPYCLMAFGLLCIHAAIDERVLLAGAMARDDEHSHGQSFFGSMIGRIYGNRANSGASARNQQRDLSSTFSKVPSQASKARPTVQRVRPEGGNKEEDKKISSLGQRMSSTIHLGASKASSNVEEAAPLSKLAESFLSYADHADFLDRLQEQEEKEQQMLMKNKKKRSASPVSFMDGVRSFFLSLQRPTPETIRNGLAVVTVLSTFIFNPTSKSTKMLVDLATQSITALALAWLPTWVVIIRQKIPVVADVSTWITLAASMLVQAPVRQYFLQNVWPEISSIAYKVIWTECWRRTWVLVVKRLKPQGKSNLFVPDNRWTYDNFPDWAASTMVWINTAVDKYTSSLARKTFERSVHTSIDTLLTSLSDLSSFAFWRNHDSRSYNEPLHLEDPSIELYVDNDDGDNGNGDDNEIMSSESTVEEISFSDSDDDSAEVINGGDDL